MTATSAPSGATNGKRFFDRLHRLRLSRVLALLLALAALGSGVATYGVITEAGFTPDPDTVSKLLVLNLVLLLLLAGVVSWRIFRLWAERRAGLAGSRLHIQFVALFGALAAAPAIIMAVFSALFFNLGVEAWFSERVRVALQESQAVAEAYLEEHRNLIRTDILAMASDLNREAPRFIADQRGFVALVQTQALLRSLPEVVVFDGRGQGVASAGLTLSLRLSFVPFWAMEQANNGELVIFNPDSDNGATAGLTDRVRALVKLNAYDELFLMVGSFVDPKVIQHLEHNREATQAYTNIEGQRLDLQTRFAAIFLVVALVLLLASIWVGLVLANRLARPIADLVGAAERVRGGDLAARVETSGVSGEVEVLSRAFNRMTSQLETQRRELVEANRQIDDRRRFTEAVLSGVSSGVIGLDSSGRVNLPNRMAATLLSTDVDALVGQDIRATIPELAQLLESARAGRPAETQISIQRGDRRRSLFVRVAAQPMENGQSGFVATFDDITELEGAQRKAAWSDIARRIAHEIKNPLTPIQLSAERLKRKYLSEITSDPETFRICTDTIIRHVGDIGRMVTEFSSFARLPAPQIREEDLAELVRQTVFLQRNARPEIAFDVELPRDRLRAAIDPRQIAQAITNLLQNAIDAIDGRDRANGEPPPGRVNIGVATRDGRLAVVVEDNGKGLPKEGRERLTEPYMTTRSKGTGLGLAIVKKIMEDHGGHLSLDDREGGGARISLVFRRDAKEIASARAHATAAQ